ncbi:hypothetical protein DSL72_008160 [Monilinia vaccinii-corymbosi]|uniref:O-methyltransferase dimerisation domain-containing protein n=1 Tax=Monilinia vaccinii-corymbosi TaxID=61207 RepID=A0A8A3PK13_9HELO|nr:hypothetical protein DSL72_008160 [Monilinia vaccinii-corymbosi]
MIRMGEDLKLFEFLASSEGSLTVEELFTETGAAPALLGRILRFLASMKLIKETGKDQYASTNVRKTFAVLGNAAGVYHHEFHDFQDDKCCSILSNIAPAMIEESVIFIDKKIIPDSNIN